MARLYVSKIKGEIKVLAQKCILLEEQKQDYDKAIESKMSELEECKLNLVQNEARLKSLQDYSKDLEHKKRKLEEELDASREHLAKQKAQQEESDNNSTSANSALESHVEQLKKQMKDLRDENESTQKKCHEVQDENQNLKLAYEKLQNDYERLKKEESDKSTRLHELIAQQEMHEQAKQDLKGLEETVAKVILYLILKRINLI